MADLEQRRHAECLGQLGAQTRKGKVGEEDIARDLLVHVLDSARIRQTEKSSPCLEVVVCVSKGVVDWVVCESTEHATTA